MADKTITQLPQLPGNLTLDAVFAVMQNGVAHKVEAENVFTAITTTSSGTSTCIRIPGAQIQVCYAKLQAVHVGSGNYLRVDEWTYPKAFNSAPALSLQVINDGSNFTPTTGDLGAVLPWTGITSTSMGNARVYSANGGFEAGDYINVDAIAIGLY